ncbi:hypothetical protein N0V90_007099 [Kalmusia sp. IMI 367209]|nr:hypothetical protein N0V90_007099 [Kalmusia sp. IMI 367209]
MDDYISGVPAPEPTSQWVTGVPAPDSANGYITGVPAVDTTKSLPYSDITSSDPQHGTITGSSAPSSSDDHITDIGTPTSTSGWVTSIPAPDDSTASDSTTPTSVAGCRPTWPLGEHTGTFRAAVMFVDFPDFPANTSFEELYGSIASSPTELFNAMSYGKFNLELVPLTDKFYRMPAGSSSYGYARDLTTEAHLRYINDVLTAVGPSVSFANIDTLYIIPPKYADEISFSTSTGNDVQALDGSTITSTITFGQDLFFSWGPKTINHEIVGWWFRFMGLIGSQSPGHFAWHKWRLNWLEEEQITYVLEPGTTEHRLSSIEIADEARDYHKAIAIPVNGTGYVMVELRSTLGINTGACGTGVLLYTADSSLGSGDRPVRVIDSKPRSGGCDTARGGEMNDAPLQQGDEFDTGLGVIVRVKGPEWNDFIVEVEKA